MAAHHYGLASPEGREVVEEASEDGSALHAEHGLGHALRELAEVRALARGQDHRGERFAGWEVATLRLRKLGVALEAEDLVHGGDLRLDGEQRLVVVEAARRLLHGADRGAQQ